VTRSTSTDHADVARDVIERVLLDLPKISARAPWREAAARAVGASLAALHRLGASPIDDPAHLELLEAASARVGEARVALEGEADAATLAKRVGSVEAALRRTRDPTIDAIVASQDRARTPSRRAPPPPVVFKASLDAAALHPLPGDPIVPWVRLEVEVDPDAAPPAPPRRQSGETARRDPDDSPEEHARRHVLRIAHDCMMEIGALGMLRRARGGERRHAGIAGFERRLLADLDALVALATPYETDERSDDGSWQAVRRRLDLVSALQGWADDAFVADDVRAFARAFVLCCVGGEDAVRAAFVALRASHPETHDAQRDAFTIASNPAVAAAARRLCHDENPALAGLALEVLRERRAPCFAEGALLLNHPDPGVRRRAARALAVEPATGPVVALLETLVAHEEAPDVVAGAVETLLAHGARSGLIHARRALRDLLGRGSPDQAARRSLVRLVAVAGGPSDAELLSEVSKKHPDEAEEIGWSGAASLTGPLRALLTSAHREVRQGAARALFRIAGPPVATTPVPDDADVEDLPTDPAAWAEPCERLAPELKHRFGRPFEVGAPLDELTGHDVTGDARETCALEVAIIGGGDAWFEPHEWLGLQTRRLRALREYFDTAPRRLRPGEWLEGRLGKRG